MSPSKAAKQRADGAIRGGLTAERVIAGAVTLADEIGIEAFTIRKLADAIDVKPPTDLDWREAILVRSRSMRTVLASHPWASPLMEARTAPGMATLRHHDAVLGCFRQAGFSLELTAHSYATVDAFLYGFALQEATLPATGGDEMRELADSVAAEMPAELLPHLSEFTIGHVMQPGYDFSNEFEFGLNLILDGLAAAAGAETER
jgi:hypothetical protein